MNTFKEFADFMHLECDMPYTEDGAIHCSECGEPIYEEDFDGECPCCSCAVLNGQVYTYDDRTETIASMFHSALERGLTDAELEEFHITCSDLSVSPLDVLSIEWDEF